MSLLALAGAALAADVALVVVDPTADGRTRAQVVLDEAIAPKVAADPEHNLRLAPGAGTARVTRATPLSAAGGGTRTFLVYDQSGSFKAHWSRSFELTDAFVDALQSPGGAAGEHTVDVGTFGKTFTTHGSASDAAGLRAALTTAEAYGTTHPVTRLHALVKDAAEAVNRELPLDRGGLRQVVVFTDLDEEGTFTADDVIAVARAQGVRLNVVAFGGARVKAKHIDEAKKLAEATGGAYIDAEDAATARAALASIATAGARTWWLELGFCDVPTSRGQDFQDNLTAEVWESSRLAASSPFPFRQRAEPATTAACQAAIEVPAPEVPKPADPPASTGLPAWVWALGACLPLGLLGLLALPFLFAGRSSAAPAPVVAKPAPAPKPRDDDAREGRKDADVFAPVAQSLLERLPTTRLVKVSGPTSIPATVAIDRARFAVGAAAGNELVLDTDTVSGRHAHLELFPNGDLWLCDDGSTNGTFAGGERLASGARQQIVHGAQVGFGRTVVFRVEQPDLAGRGAPPAPPPEPRPEATAKAPEPEARPRARTTFRPLKPGGGG